MTQHPNDSAPAPAAGSSKTERVGTAAGPTAGGPHTIVTPDGYAAVRGVTETLCTNLDPEDCGAQSMADTSPAKWHLAHTTWFFETFVLLLTDNKHLFSKTPLLLSYRVPLPTCSDPAGGIENQGWIAIPEGVHLNWRAPLYWPGDAKGYREFTLSGERNLKNSEPVSNVSFFEADAYARWADARLSTGCEWEVAGEGRVI